MGKFPAILMCATALGCAAPAFAAETVSFTTGWNNSYVGSKIYTGSDGTRVKVMGFSINGSGQIVAGQLGLWSGGLGIQNSSGDDSHTTDNSGWKDFLLLSFDTAVQLDKGMFTTNYSYDGGTLRDTDATIGATQFTGAWNGSFAGLAGQNSSVLNALGLWSSNSTATSYSERGINAGNVGGNLWLVGASFTNSDGRVDGFKFKNATYSVFTPPPPPVPEPGTWALLILGFGGVGAAMRKRKQQAVAFA